MNNLSLDFIKQLLNKKNISQITFIQGLKKYNFQTDQVNPDRFKKRPYVIYQGTLNNKPVIVKILVRNNYYQFFQREVFVYRFLAKIIPETDKFLPQLIDFSQKPLPYMIMRYYKNYQALGQYNLVTNTITKTDLLDILKAIDSFHRNKKDLENKIRKVNQSSPFIVTEPFSFYLNRFHHETKNYLIKIFDHSTLTKLEKLFIKTKPAFNKLNHYFSWGDANPANILISQKDGYRKIKFIDFEKVGYSYLPRDFTTLYYSLYLTNVELADFLYNWLQKKYRNQDFWQVFYFKLIIYSFPRQYRYFAEKKQFSQQKKISDCAKISLSTYFNLF